MIESLPFPTCAILVHRTYESRVKDFMLGIKSDWIKVEPSDGNGNDDGNDDGNDVMMETPITAETSNNVGTKRKFPSVPISTSKPAISTGNEDRCWVIQTPFLPGVRKNRRGFVMMIVEDYKMQMKDLSPMARHKISAGYILTHRISQSHDTKLGDLFLDFLLQQINFDIQNDVLRVIPFPQHLSESICRPMQIAALQRANQQVPSDQTQIDPFDGLLQVTRSASKSTVTLYFVQDDKGQQDDQQVKYLVGVVRPNQQSQSSKPIFNDDAKKEIIIEPTDSAGADLSQVAKDAPVSRAYYKLKEVWDDCLVDRFGKKELPEGIGVDLGSSPGGWTQVLKTHVGLKTVISIDPGVLAHRVKQLDGVEHVVGELSSDHVVAALRNQGAPISMLVCDASTDSREILNRISTLMEKLGKGSMTLPVAWVLTMKLPFKTVASVERHSNMAAEKIPVCLQQTAAQVFQEFPAIQFRIVHLMSNSESERTVVVVFDTKHNQ